MINIFLSYNRKDINMFNAILNSLKPLRKYCNLWYYQPTVDNDYPENIIELLPEVDLFAVFISDNSLSSKCVQEELLEAINLSKLGKIREICPISIDINITSITANSDSRIPEYIKNSISHTTSPITAAQIIEESTKKIIELGSRKS